MNVTPVVSLLGQFTEVARAVAPALAGLGFVMSALQFLIAHVVGSNRGQDVGKAGMLGSVLGLVGVYFAPQIMALVKGAFQS